MRWLDLWDLETAICQQCGQPRDLCSDPEREWFPLRLVDYAAMNQRAAEALYGAIHEARPYHDGTFRQWAKERSPVHPFHYLDGVTIVVTEADVSPDDHFTTQESASPVAHQAPPGQPHVDEAE